MKKYGKKHPYLRKGFKFDCDKPKNETFTIDKRKDENTRLSTCNSAS